MRDEDTKKQNQISVAMKLNVEENELTEQAMVKTRCFKKSTWFKKAGLDKAKEILNIKSSTNHSNKSD